MDHGTKTLWANKEEYEKCKSRQKPEETEILYARNIQHKGNKNYTIEAKEAKWNCPESECSGSMKNTEVKRHLVQKHFHNGTHMHLILIFQDKTNYERFAGNGWQTMTGPEQAEDPEPFTDAEVIIAKQKVQLIKLIETEEGTHCNTCGREVPLIKLPTETNYRNHITSHIKEHHIPTVVDPIAFETPRGGRRFIVYPGIANEPIAPNPETPEETQITNDDACLIRYHRTKGIKCDKCVTHLQKPGPKSSAKLTDIAPRHVMDFHPSIKSVTLIDSSDKQSTIQLDKNKDTWWQEDEDIQEDFTPDKTPVEFNLNYDVKDKATDVYTVTKKRNSGYKCECGEDLEIAKLTDKRQFAQHFKKHLKQDTTIQVIVKEPNKDDTYWQYQPATVTRNQETKRNSHDTMISCTHMPKKTEVKQKTEKTEVTKIQFTVYQQDESDKTIYQCSMCGRIIKDFKTSLEQALHSHIGKHHTLPQITEDNQGNRKYLHSDPTPENPYHINAKIIEPIPVSKPTHTTKSK